MQLTMSMACRCGRAETAHVSGSVGGKPLFAPLFGSTRHYGVQQRVLRLKKEQDDRDERTRAKPPHVCTVPLAMLMLYWAGDEGMKE